MSQRGSVPEGPYRGSDVNSSFRSSRTSAWAAEFMPDTAPLGGRSSPLITDEAETFEPDPEDSWCVTLAKEVYDETVSLKFLKLTGVLVLLICCGTVETINYSVNGQRYMAQYLTTLNVLVVGGGTLFFFAIVGIKLCTDQDYYESEMAWIWKGPHKVWFFRNIVGISMCDTVGLYMGILASHNVTAPMRSMLQQANIPSTMIASYIFLGRRYRNVHVVGAVIIMVGIALAVLQTLLGGTHGHKDTSVNGDSDTSWTVIFFLSCIPVAIGSCLKEHILTDETRSVDMNQVNAWVAMSQLALGLAISPLSYMAANMDPDGGIPAMSGFGNNLVDGFKCGVWGDQHACNAQCVFINGNSTDCPDIPNTPHCDCGLHLAPLSVWLYVAVCCLFNLLMLYVIKEGTAVLFWISSAAVIPVVAILSTTSLYDGLDLGRVSFSALQICGLALVVFGIAVYRSKREDPLDHASFSPRSPEAYDMRHTLMHNAIKHKASMTAGGSASPRGGSPKRPSWNTTPQHSVSHSPPMPGSQPSSRDRSFNR